MKITVEMACSINGLIATKDGNEDFLSNRNYQIMLGFLKEYDCLVWEIQLLKMLFHGEIIILMI